MRVGFFGTPELASRVLSDIVESSFFDVAFVVTNPDKPFGRDQVMRPTPVKALALTKNIPIFTPEKIRGNEQLLNDIGSYDCDYFIVVAYGRILPLELLRLAKKMCINVHGSILPKYRGASPIQAALLHGERETGVTIMEMSVGMDEGDILKIRNIPIDARETSETLFLKFAEVSGPTLIQTLRELDMGGITPLPQNHADATYCKKIEKEDGLIDWFKSAEEIYHMWQAYTPWPGIYTMYEGRRFLLEKISIIPGLSRNPEIPMESSFTGFPPTREGQKPGQVMKLEDGTIAIQCGKGILTLDQVKIEGKKSQSIKDFVNGNQGFISSTF